MGQGEKHEVFGGIDYVQPGQLTLNPFEWLWTRPDGTSTRFEAQENRADPAVGNGCWLVPSGYLTMSCSQIEGRDQPTFELKYRAPTVVGSGDNRVAAAGQVNKVEIYLDVKKK